MSMPPCTAVQRKSPSAQPPTTGGAAGGGTTAAAAGGTATPVRGGTAAAGAAMANAHGSIARIIQDFHTVADINAGQQPCVGCTVGSSFPSSR
ncbi:hypothetical protein FOH10_09605 [Nocardia otitidiscaviarum]|uniref:Uncharacterized protein n=1 Tax=Nocardia otitidiscaviarum TaxID=1823 RepID=A0A516NJA6_9NOCA|nr:hypothetical protein FOH10_09605 [Nocardia otitidiscaviarum]